MTDHINLTGMVLSSMPAGDYDRRVTILTTERGKITAFARGARRTNSQLMAPTSPFCFGQFELIEGRNSYTLLKADIRNYFRNLTQDPMAAYTGFYFLEFASYFCQENNDEKEMLKLLYKSLEALQSAKYDKALVRGIFETKALMINGEGLQLFRCTKCGRQEEDPKRINYLSLSRGGVLCRECSQNYPGFPVSGTVLYTLQFIACTRVEKLFSFALTPEAQEEFLHIVSQYVHTYVRHTFKSLDILDGLMQFT